MKPPITRICIYPKDVQRITGRGETYSRNLIAVIKKSLGKEPHQLLTVYDLCAYLGLPLDAVREMIRD